MIGNSWEYIFYRSHSVAGTHFLDYPPTSFRLPEWPGPTVSYCCCCLLRREGANDRAPRLPQQSKYTCWTGWAGDERCCVLPGGWGRDVAKLLAPEKFRLNFRTHRDGTEAVVVVRRCCCIADGGLLQQPAKALSSSDEIVNIRATCFESINR